MSADQQVMRLTVRDDLDPEDQALLAAVAIQFAAEVRDETSPMSTLLRHLPFAAMSVGPDLIFTGASGSALARLGLTADEVIGMPIAAWGEQAVAMVQQVHEGTAQMFEVDGVSAGNNYRFRCLGVPDGVGGSVAVMIDLTDVLVAEQSATEDRELLYAAIEASGGGYLVRTADGELLMHNPAVEELFGRSAAEVFGDKEHFGGLDAVHADGRMFDLADFPSAVALETGAPQRNVTIGFRHPDGDRRWVSVSAFPIRLHDRAAVVTSIVDLSSQRLTTSLLRDSDERFRLLAERAPLGILIIDRGGDVLYANPQATEIVGRSSVAICELGWRSLIHPDDREIAYAADPDGPPVEYRVSRPDGSIRWVRERGAPLVDADGDVIGSVVTAADVTDLRLANARLKERDARTRAIVETAAEGIVTVDERGVIVEFNAAAERLFGYDSEDVIGRVEVFTMLAPADRERILGYFHSYLDGNPSKFIGRNPTEIAGLHKDGTVVPIELAITELRTNEGRLFTSVIRDMSERKAFELELEHLATHDPLTGLPNRTLLSAQLETALARAVRHRSSVGVLFVDIDRLKLVTEALGHAAGDDLLMQAAARLRKTTGSSATLARFSGDQFVVVLEDLDDVGDAVEVATAIIEQINEPFSIVGEEAFVNASVGIAFAPVGAGVAETLVSNADVAMGRAKASSFTRFEVFDAEMRAWVENQRKTEIALRHGIERNELVLHYQPVIDLDDLEIHGFEALVRWEHPQLGLLPPGGFVPVAEDSGLIVPMGEWILREAIRQSARWQEAATPVGDPLSIAINLSARQLAQPDLAAVVASALDDVDVDPGRVVFEITETVLLDDVDAVERRLTELKHLGVQISLDDFGTGYSSLTYLCRLPIDIVKVDRSFVSQLGTGSRDASIVEMVVGLGRTLDLDVVAEGVETEEQAEVLRGWGCRFAQGFLFSKPRPVDEIDAMLGRAPVIEASAGHRALT